MTQETDALSTQLGLRPCDQIGFVYRDLEAAIARLDPVFGPFDRQQYGEMTWNYRGVDEDSEILIAFGHSGDLEIELIQWVSGPTPHKEFLDAGHEGMQHIRFVVDDLDEMIERARPLGWQAIWHKRFGEGLATAYMERADESMLVEFFENHALAAG